MLTISFRNLVKCIGLRTNRSSDNDYFPRAITFLKAETDNLTTRSICVSIYFELLERILCDI